MIQANPVQANSIFPFFLILLFKVKRKKIHYLILISKKEGLIVPGGSGSTQRMKIYCDDHCYCINFHLEEPPSSLLIRSPPQLQAHLPVNPKNTSRYKSPPPSVDISLPWLEMNLIFYDVLKSLKMRVNSRSILISTARFIACFEMLSLISYLVNLRQPSHFPLHPILSPLQTVFMKSELKVQTIYFYSCNNVICVTV